MRSAQLAGISPTLLDQIHQLVPPTDNKARFFLCWWLRMHQDAEPLVAVSLKTVEWSDEGAVAQRFVWEVCRWPQGRSAGWTFVCWMIDGNGMWTRPFPSKRAALAYFDQAPAVVMAKSDSPAGAGMTQGVQYKAAS